MGNAERSGTVRKLSGGSSLRVVVAAVLGVGVLTAGSGCTVGLLASLAGSSQYYGQVLQAVDALPSANVRIVNETEAEATVSLASSIKMPTGPPGLGPMLYPYDGAEYMESADEKSVRVAAGGTVTGTFKCGETIGISVMAGGGDSVFADYPYLFGLSIGGGNINLTGAGGPSGGDFAGDMVSSIRYITPADDGLDCTVGTIVILIQTPSTPSVYSEETGRLVTRGDMGTGTVSIE